jgi:hypothetical protein
MLARNGSGAAAVGTAEPREFCELASPQIPDTEIDLAIQAVRLFCELGAWAPPGPYAQALERWLSARGIGATALELAGPIYELPILRFAPDRKFQLCEPEESGAVMAVVHVVRGCDAETLIGLVAWCRDRPEEIFTYPAGLPALGLDQLDNPASYFAGGALRVHRSPLSWLRAGCQGIAPLDYEALWLTLKELPDIYALSAECVEHGHALQAALDPLPANVRLVVPRRKLAA